MQGINAGNIFANKAIYIKIVRAEAGVRFDHIKGKSTTQTLCCHCAADSETIGDTSSNLQFLYRQRNSMSPKGLIYGIQPINPNEANWLLHHCTST